MHPLRNKAIALRKRGRSYREINTVLGIAKGTLSYMLKDVLLSAKQRERLDKRAAANRRRFAKHSSEYGLESKARALAKFRKEYPERCEQARIKAVRVSMTTYRKDELGVKRTLEVLYNTPFVKEIVQGQAVDFVSNTHLIEHTRDGTKGLSDVIRRFAKLQLDRRRKIAYVDTQRLGPMRRAKLVAVVDEIVDYRTLLS